MASGRDTLNLAALDSVPLLGAAIIVESGSTAAEDSLVVTVTTDLLTIDTEGPVADPSALEVKIASHAAIAAVDLQVI